MAFSGGLSGRMDELRFPNHKTSGEGYTYSGYTSPQRNAQDAYFGNLQPTGNDARSSLQRRRTTDSSKMSVASFGGQYAQGQSEYSAVLDSQKNQQIEQIRAQKRKMEEQMALLDLQEQEIHQPAGTPGMDRVSNRFNRVSLTAVSEPTTPPEHAENGFLQYSSRPGHYSMNSVTSPPGLTNRFSQSNSQISSPARHRASTGMYSQSQKPPAKSMPGSRRGSDDEDYYPEDVSAERSTPGFNRYSMPVNSNKNAQRLSISNNMSQKNLGPLNTTSFLFDENEDKHPSLNGTNGLISPIAKAYMQLGGDDGFPTLRSNGPGLLSANSAALDLANSKTPDMGADIWASGSKLRPSHQSMPQTELNMYRPVLDSLPDELIQGTSGKKPQRHSMGVAFGESPKFDGTPTSTAGASRPTALQSSYSTNDLPTVKTSNSLISTISPQKTHAEQHLHNHNASMGRIPPGAINNRQSRDLATRLSMNDSKVDDKISPGYSALSALQASAAPFGPPMSTSAQPSSLVNANAPGTAAYNSGALYSYGMHTYNVNGMSAQMALNTQLQAYQGPNPGAIAPYGSGYAHYGRSQDGLQRGGSSGRRMNTAEEARFNNIPLAEYSGRLYELCKDQHGCRYLQRKLEDRNPEQTQHIFLETRPHIIELMTDPFGNYLCQKLFEHCSNDQRTALINTASPSLVPIALNQHGTRALQKMIEFVKTDEQVDTIINSLCERVVELVQDLNGNHVVQKCLTRLGAPGCQFIYDAVGKHCVIVGTHRHGCCVLQRCIDHAAGHQRAQLIARITTNAFSLVQDPYGNYVVQYILDLDEAMFTKPLCLAFNDNVCSLSKQKFSSNVIEKCLRTADFETKRLMIDEMLRGNELEKMLRDSFANYVIQTAMDHADAETKMRIIDHVRPILPAIKQTPHGRRIAGKIMALDGQGRLNGNTNGQLASNDFAASDTFPASRSGPNAGRRQVQVLGGGFFGGGSSNSARMTNGFAGAGTGARAFETSFQGRDYRGMNNAGVEMRQTAGHGYTASHANNSFNNSAYGSFASNQPGNYF